MSRRISTQKRFPEKDTNVCVYLTHLQHSFSQQYAIRLWVFIRSLYEIIFSRLGFLVRSRQAEGFDA